MRLKTIKLAGFKSFVDPTSVNFPSNMCAVVGPNGCGKSNIIDAVRWVMGESSAKNLRGESMTDVIFNGSGSRKPVGQASIELVFDNSDGTIKGEYAGYNEISVKRRVTRDAQNLYYLNGNRCRRRDITDLFLGTGLGPRSYAIIEQGMISRLIESKPEELRVYIEEAAGISKYKERRKDTENRMRRTHENLERLTDIREELERQLTRLERQAKAAEKYSIFKREEREFNAKLHAVRFRSLRQESDQIKQRITEAELKVEGSVTQRVKLDTAIEKHRSEFSEKTDQFNDIQGQFYSIGADIARVEQSIKHSKERERSLRVDLEQTIKDCAEAEDHLALDSAKIEGWDAELLDITPEVDMLKESLESSHIALQSAEESMQEWQQRWDGFNQQAAEPKQTAEVQQSRIQYLEQVQQRLNQRKEKVNQELAEIDIDDEAEEIALHEETVAELEIEADQLSEILATAGEKITALREAHADESEQRAQRQSQMQTQRGRLSSLEALQSAALGKEGDGAGAWIEAQGLTLDKRLGEEIAVESGWEKAVEVVLGEALQAICTDRPIDEFLGALESLEHSADVLSTASVASREASDQSGRLCNKMSSAYDLSALLGGVRTADNLSEAREIIRQLTPGESVVTRDGYWLSNAWLRVTRQSDSESGVIARSKEIELLSESVETLSDDIDTRAERIAELSGQLKAAENQREACRREQEAKRRQANDARTQLATQKGRVDQLLAKRERAKQDVQEITAQLVQESDNLSEARAILEEAIIAIEGDSAQREALLTQRDGLRAALDDARQSARHAQDKNHEYAMRHKSLQTQLDSMRQGIQRLNEQISRMHERRDQLKASLEDVASPGEEHALELEALLEKRIAIEVRLNEARKSLENTEQALRDAERSRDQSEKTITEQRSGLEHSRLEMKALDVKAQNIEQQLGSEDFDLEEVLNSLAEEDEPDTLQQMLEQLANKISRLGPINLAAIDEFKTESERKNYLDEQHEDLCEALETLEEAIKKIDKETRTRFKETYDQVNTGLQNLFPRLFGGGHAYLELTGDDMLDTGIAIMARPPGKKNSTIHLLSGGEKALTAIALVFSIFQLNPAPFCMLDEVDAPLDDANVGRYANIVEAMSEQVQFIYITHNKIAMEKAKHLMGVTMQEAGVSRMVTVDVEEAAELAAI